MKYFLIIISVLLFSCSSNSQEKIPNNILSKEKMIVIYTDVHLAFALAKKDKIKDVKIVNQLNKTYFNNILQKNNITLEEFELASVFYQDNLAIMNEVYEEVMINLSKLEADLEGEKKVDQIQKK